jgi:hypothetical protein
VKDFIAKDLDLLFVEGKLAGYVFVVGGVLGNKRTLLDQSHMLPEVVLSRELLDVAQEHIARETSQRVLDPEILSA